jgi:outer membrane biogenesis lipoprotein LolB
MIRQVKDEGVKAIVHNSNFKIFSITFLAVAAFILNACTGTSTSNTTGGGTVDANETPRRERQGYQNYGNRARINSRRQGQEG